MKWKWRNIYCQLFSYLVSHHFLSPRFPGIVVGIQNIPDRSTKSRLKDDARQREHRQLGAVPRRQAADVDVGVGGKVSKLDLARGCHVTDVRRDVTDVWRHGPPAAALRRDEDVVGVGRDAIEAVENERRLSSVSYYLKQIMLNYFTKKGWVPMLKRCLEPVYFMSWL